MKQTLREMKLSVPFRTICFQCKKELSFNDQKYADSGVHAGFYGYYCEECANQSGARILAKNN